jgi:8-oxo-dGTP pyrophosphatase MutT (NUDIX family)
MIKIHSADKSIFLTNNKNLSKPVPGTITVSISSQNELTEFYAVWINQKDIKEIFFYNENEELLLEWFESMFHIVEAAGGIVKNREGEYLFIYRHGKWDLPKGKIEADEPVEKAAIREVEEECGISELVLGKKIEPTYHIYFMNDKAILKPTYWFEMFSEDTSTLIPQLEEGITEVRWIKPENFEIVRKNTYESIKDVLSGL